MATSSFILLQIPMTNVQQEYVGENNEAEYYDTCGDLIVYIFVYCIDYYSLLN